MALIPFVLLSDSPPHVFSVYCTILFYLRIVEIKICLICLEKSIFIAIVDLIVGIIQNKLTIYLERNVSVATLKKHFIFHSFGLHYVRHFITLQFRSRSAVTLNGVSIDYFGFLAVLMLF